MLVPQMPGASRDGPRRHHRLGVQPSPAPKGFEVALRIRVSGGSCWLAFPRGGGGSAALCWLLEGA
eukprot:7861070-Alexandrium_andersonii.AAC.1